MPVERASTPEKLIERLNVGALRSSHPNGGKHPIQCLSGEMQVIDSRTITNVMRSRTLSRLAFILAAASACSSHDATTGPTQTTGTGSTSFTNNPCSVSGTLQLAVAQSTRVDCSNGGTTLTLAGNGASYLVVAQLAVDRVPDTFVPYHVSSGTAIVASRSPLIAGLSAMRTSVSPSMGLTGPGSGDAIRVRPRAKQLAFDRMLRARARRQVSSGAWRASKSLSRSVSASMSPASPAVRTTVPPLGSTRSFHVLSNNAGTAFTTVNAQLVYSGSDVLIYMDAAAPTGGFTSDQLQAFGQLFDQTFYPIDTTAFGPPTDIDQNGHVIMLMTPVVNSLTTSSDCQTQGYVAGFFEEDDLGGVGSADSNNGEIFYTVVPDPNGTKSCAHTVDDVGLDVPATFMHELQHLISFSQHVVARNGNPEYGWLDEGLSIVAEELGSLYYENKYPPPSGRTSPSQLFPDSSQGFIASFLYDSYQYALLPDTASVTLHDDSEDGFSWRGGDWLLMRWLGDQMGTGIFKKLDQNTLTGVANIESASGQPFPSLFANFGLSLFTDSIPNLPRATAPTVNRFTTRNVRQLWNRLFVTSSGSDVPLSMPLQLFSIDTDTSTAIMDPGTGSYFRLDTPATSATVSIQFSGPGGSALPASLKPQLAIFRLPPGQ